MVVEKIHFLFINLLIYKYVFFTDNECTCKRAEKKTASPARGSSPTQPSGQTHPANRQPQRGPFQAMTEFEPAIQCLCHAYRV